MPIQFEDEPKIDFAVSPLLLVSAGEKVRTGRRHDATIGGLVVDAAGTIYALVPRTLFETPVSGSVHRPLHLRSKANGESIGAVPSPLPASASPRAICDLIGLAPISSNVAVSSACDTLEQLAAPLNFDLDRLGQSVRLYRLSGIKPLGHIGRMNSIIKLRDRDGLGRAPYGQTLEIKLSCDFPLRPGDGGSLVFSDSKEPIGMLVGLASDRAIVAPLSPLFDKIGLHFLTREEALSHNSAAAAEIEGDVARRQLRFAQEADLLGSIGLRKVA